MKVLKGFLFFAAGSLALGTLGLAWLVSLLHWFPAVLVSAGGLTSSFFLFRAAQGFGSKAEQRQREGFERTLRMLAAQNEGSVRLDAIVAASGQGREEVQKQMRELMGRGVCQLGFGAEGEMVFEMTPMEESRQDLAALQGRVRE